MIRILQIVPNMQAGGLESFIMNVYRNIDRNKIQFDFLVHYKEKKHYDEEIEIMGGKIYRFSLRNNNNLFKYIKELNKFYQEHKEYKIVHCHMSSIGFIHFLIAKKNGVKVRIAHSHNSSTDKTFKGIIKRILMIGYKYTSTKNYACSNDAGKYLYGKKSFKVIPNAIDTEIFRYNDDYRYEIRKNFSISQKSVVFGHIGRFNIQKNHEFLIKLFYEYYKVNKDSYLLLVGDGELKKIIENKVKELNLNNNVIFAGTVSDTWKYYSAFDLFLLPSFFEGLPLVAIEAQSNGLKSIFSNKITNEASVTDLIEYVPLNINEWLKEVKSFKSEKNREKYGDLLKKSKFSIKSLSKQLQEDYIKMYYEER